MKHEGMLKCFDDDLGLEVYNRTSSLHEGTPFLSRSKKFTWLRAVCEAVLQRDKYLSEVNQVKLFQKFRPMYANATVQSFAELSVISVGFAVELTRMTSPRKLGQGACFLHSERSEQGV